MALTDNLIGLWTPSAGPTGYTLIDRSGRNNHGTLTNMTASDWAGSVVRGVAGWSLNFDGTDNVVNIGGSQVYAKLGTPFTASIWFYTRAFSNTYPVLLALRSDSGQPYEIGISSGGPTYLGVLVGANATWVGLNSGTSTTTFVDRWCHLIVTYNGGTRSTAANFSVMLNGLPLTMSASGFLGVLANNSTIGLNTNNYRHSGLIGETAVAERVWSQSEAVEAYRAGNGAILNRLIGRSRRRVYGFVPPTGARRRRILCGDYS